MVNPARLIGCTGHVCLSIWLHTGPLLAMSLGGGSEFVRWNSALSLISSISEEDSDVLTTWPSISAAGGRTLLIFHSEP